MSEHDDHLSIALAQNGASDSEARQRAAKRLTQDRQPGAAASSGTWVDWTAEANVLGQPWDSAKIPLAKLEQMRRDPILAFALMFVKVPLIRAPWYIKSSDPRIAAAVDASLRKIYGRFILAYCNSFDFGFSPMVKRFDYEENPDWVYVPNDNSLAEEKLVWDNKTVKPIVWKPFTALNPRRAAPHWDSKGNFNGIDFASQSMMSPFFTSGYPMTPGITPTQGKIADIPLDWALWATNEKDSVFGSYWGYPRIGYAYRFWWAYWYRFGVSDRAFEKWGDPPVIVYHPNDPLAIDNAGNPIDYTDKALYLAESARNGANVAMPSSVVSTLDEKATNVREWSIEQMKTSVDFKSIQEVFSYLDVQKLRSVMVPEQALVEGEGGTSSRNVAATFGELFQESQAVVKEEIDDHLNRWVIPQFVNLNFGADAAKAEIVTTGFDAMDIETMQEIVRLIGQREVLSLVDQRELLERMGVPLVSRKEMNERLAKAAAEAEASVPAPQDSVPNRSAGVTSQGLYYEPRDRIVLGQQTPYLVERVDELPADEDGPKAYFDAETRILYVRKDADPDKVKGYMLGLMSKALTNEGEDLPDPQGMELMFEELKRVSEKIEGIANKDTNFQVDLQQKEDDFDVEREFERDEDGLVKKTIERKVPRGGKQSD